MSSAKMIAGTAAPAAAKDTVSAAMMPTLAYTTPHTMVLAHCLNIHRSKTPRKKEAMNAVMSQGYAALMNAVASKGAAASALLDAGVGAAAAAAPAPRVDGED